MSHVFPEASIMQEDEASLEPDRRNFETLEVVDRMVKELRHTQMALFWPRQQVR